MKISNHYVNTQFIRKRVQAILAI